MLLSALLLGAFSPQAVHLDLPGDSSTLFGALIDATGDLDGDGFPDFVVGHRSAETGRRQVLARSGLDGSVLWQRRGEAPALELGARVAGVGDFDGDGVPDVAAVVPRDEPIYPFDAYPGETHVLSGVDGSTLHVWPALAYGSPVDVHAVGDIDGDGDPDVLVSFEATDPVEDGFARVYSGRDGALVREMREPAAYAYAIGATGLGDVDGDGRGDLAVTISKLAGQTQRHGTLRVLSGASGVTLYDVEVGDHRRGVARLGDLDGDGIRELAAALGDPFSGDVLGAIRVHSGASGALLFEVRATEPEPRGWGSAVVPAGDFDGDGLEDFLVSSGALNGDFVMEVRSGRQGALLARLPSSESGGLQGDVALLGDLNGDGRGDLVFGELSTSLTSGVVRIVLGGIPEPRRACEANEALGAARIELVGSPSIGAGTFALAVRFGESRGEGLLVAGTGVSDAPLLPLGPCVSGTVLRLSPRLALDDVGAGQLAFDLDAPPFHGGLVEPGSTLGFQFAERTGGGLRFSSALELTFGL